MQVLETRTCSRLSTPRCPSSCPGSPWNGEGTVGAVAAPLIRDTGVLPRPRRAAQPLGRAKEHVDFRNEKQHSAFELPLFWERLLSPRGASDALQAQAWWAGAAPRSDPTTPRQVRVLGGASFHPEHLLAGSFLARKHTGRRFGKVRGSSRPLPCCAHLPNDRSEAVIDFELSH